MRALIGLFFLANAIPVVHFAARVPSRRRCKSDCVLTFGELEQFIKANPSKKGTKRKLDVEPKSDSDSDNSSDSESVRKLFFNDLIAPLESAAWQH
jgi:hypothetical protein